VSTWPPSNPVMGFSTWYAFRTAISESLILQQANLLISTGLADAGYDCINLDDGWMSATRDTNGNLVADPTKFPNGMAEVAERVHDLGLRFGIYTAIGTRTCQNLPGSYGHYQQDAQTFADWGIDFVKVDECGGLTSGTTQASLTTLFRQFGQYINQYMPNAIYSQELPIYVLGQSGFVQAVADSSTFANMWRVVADEYPLTQANAYPSLLSHLSADLHLHAFAGPGHWNDLDMIAPDYPASGWTLQDLENQLAIWAMEASPLIISADLSKVPSNALAALKNPHMIAANQSGAQCPTSVTDAHVQVLVKPDPEGGIAACFVNMGTGTASAEFTLAQLGVFATSATSTDVWSGSTTAPFSSVGITLAAGTTKFVRIQGVA
jgi:alpha-galactosidase